MGKATGGKGYGRPTDFPMGCDRFLAPAMSAFLVGRSLRSRITSRKCSLRAKPADIVLLVDADIHGIELIKQGISCLRKMGEVQTEIFAPPERLENKQWAAFLQEPGITLRPVPRSTKRMHEPNDRAIISSMRKLANGSAPRIALLTSDGGFASAFVDLQASRSSFMVMVPEKSRLVAKCYEEIPGLELLKLRPKEKSGSRVRAVLHADGTGSVHLAEPFDEMFDDDEMEQSVRNFLDDLGFSRGTEYLSQAIPKFWLANNLGSLTVYPEFTSIPKVYNILNESRRAQSWKRYKSQAAFLLPTGTQGKITDKQRRIYGSRGARAVFRGGGPILLKDSKKLTSQALKRLGFLDDNLNADENEAMFCFINLPNNKNPLRKLGLLPEPTDNTRTVKEKLRQALLSHASPGEWQVRNKADNSTKKMQQLLQKEGLLSTSQLGCAQHEMLEAMKRYVKKHQLQRMQTYNGLACQLNHHSDPNPDKRSMIGFGPFEISADVKL